MASSVQTSLTHVRSRSKLNKYAATTSFSGPEQSMH